MQYGYDSLASVYDQFNNGFDYPDYFNTIQSALADTRNPFGNKMALDCGCGTGALMEILTREGFTCTGVDISPEMLQIAKEKPALKNARLICQNLAELDLYRAYDLAICSLDTVNHLTKKNDLQVFFQKVYHFVEENGYFIFDAKTEKAFRETKGVSVFHEEDSVLIFENTFHSPIFGQYLTVFQELPNGSFRKTDSFVRERLYKPAEITQMMKKTPFTRIAKIPYHERNLYIYKKIL